MSDYQFIDVQRRNDVDIVHLTDVNSLDSLQLGDLIEELMVIANQETCTKMVITFEEVALCTTTVVNGLLSVHRAIAGRDGQLRLCGMSNNVRASFQILNLDGPIFKIHDSEFEALADL